MLSQPQRDRLDAAPASPPAGSPRSSQAATGAAELGERVVARATILGLSPVLLVRAAVAKATTGRVFDGHRRLGAVGEPIVIRSFAGNAYGRRLAYLFSVARGDMRVIGPQPLPLSPGGAPSPGERAGVTPGFLSAHRLRARTGIDYEPEPSAMDQNLFHGHNAGLVARYAVAELVSGGHRPTPATMNVLGVTIANTTLNETLEWIAQCSAADRLHQLAFVNPDCLNQAVDNDAYRQVLAGADRVVPDGIGVKIAARFLGIDVAQNVNGTDLFPPLCELARDRRIPLYLLGGQPGVAQTAAQAMQERFPGLQIAGSRDGFFDESEADGVIAAINASGARVLLVAMGVPKQELWIQARRDQLRVGVAAGVGGLFDFYSGRIPRAPLWLRELGLEWIWRLAQEPRRMWRRYVIGNPLFLLRVRRDARDRGIRTSSARPPLLSYPAESPSAPDRGGDEPAAGLPATSRSSGARPAGSTRGSRASRRTPGHPAANPRGSRR